MPAIIGPIKGASAPTPATPAASTTAVSNAPRQQAYNPPPSNDRDDEGVRREEGDSTEVRAPGLGSYPKYDSFTHPWRAGNHTYVSSVQKIVKWSFGTIVTLRVEVGPERGRQIDWGQSHSERLTAEQATKWRSNLFGAYAAGGWPLDPDPETGWPGWEKNSMGVGIPPYDKMFVHTAPDGVQVPVLLEVDTWTGTKDDARPFINAVRHWLPDGATMPIQAPMPFHVPAWLARRHGWTAAPDAIVTRNGTIEVVKVDYKQVPFNHGGLQTLRDIMKGGR